MLVEKPQCPEVKDYPLDDEVKKEILKCIYIIVKKNNNLPRK